MKSRNESFSGAKIYSARVAPVSNSISVTQRNNVSDGNLRCLLISTCLKHYAPLVSRLSTQWLPQLAFPIRSAVS